MKIIVGLGNKGEKYSKNRHNVGFMLLDRCADKWNTESKFDSLIYKLGEDLYIKPQTFMNDSGEAVSKVVNFYKLQPKDVVVVHDDIDLPLGEVKKQFGAGAAGHRGVSSVIDQLGTKDFWRIRVGVGRPENPEMDPADYVLSDFSVEELQVVNSIDIEKMLLFK